MSKDSSNRGNYPLKTSYRRPETRNYPYRAPWTSKQIDSVIMLTEPIPTHHVDSDLSVENNPDQKNPSLT
jgi:hypothetical protein